MFDFEKSFLICFSWTQKIVIEGRLCTRHYLRTRKVLLLVKNLPANAGNVRDTGSISGLRRSSRGAHGNPFQYCLENPMARGAWQAAAHRVAQSWTWRNNFACMHARMRRRMLCLVFACKFIDHQLLDLFTSNQIKC